MPTSSAEASCSAVMGAVAGIAARWVLVAGLQAARASKLKANRVVRSVGSWVFVVLVIGLLGLVG